MMDSLDKTRSLLQSTLRFCIAYCADAKVTRDNLFINTPLPPGTMLKFKQWATKADLVGLYPIQYSYVRKALKQELIETTRWAAVNRLIYVHL